MYVQRSLETVIQEMSRAFPVVLVSGPRQVGKTIMHKKLATSERKYVTLDNPLLRDLAKNDPDLFLQRYTPPVLIDEIQYAPELLPFIKMYVDEHKNKGDFWLIGSQMFHLKKDVGESLAGRVGIANMLGLSQSELTGKQNAPYATEYDELMKKGVRSDNLLNVYNRIYKDSMPALYPIEIKKSAQPKSDSIRHFTVLGKTGLKVGNGNVICLCSDLVPIDSNNFFVPVSMI